VAAPSRFHPLRWTSGDTGPWIFGQQVMLPAGLIQRVDHDSEKVFVATDKDQVKDPPGYREDSADTSVSRQSSGDCYGRSTGR